MGELRVYEDRQGQVTAPRRQPPKPPAEEPSEEALAGRLFGDAAATEELAAEGQSQRREKRVRQVGEKEDNGEKATEDGSRHPTVSAAWHDPDDADDDGELLADTPANAPVGVSLTAPARRRKLRRALEETHVSQRQFVERLAERYRALYGVPEWAQRLTDAAVKGSGAMPPEHTTTARGDDAHTPNPSSSRPPLPGRQLRIRRLTDANAAAPSAAVVRSLEFHPGAGHLLFTAGLDKRLRLFHIGDDGESSPADAFHGNRCLHTACFADLPVWSAHFLGPPRSPYDQRVVLAGRRRYFYEYDLGAMQALKVRTLESLRHELSFERFIASPAMPLLAFYGDNGQVVLVSAASKQVVGMVRVGGGAGAACDLRAAAFSPDGRVLACAGRTGGYVHLYDIRAGRGSASESTGTLTPAPLARLADEGSLQCTALAWSPCGRVLATGSDSGVVNLYPMEKGQADTLSALHYQRAVMNLTTRIDHLSFTPDTQALVYASGAKRNALRVLHTATGHTFANWPTQQTPLQRVSAAAVSPGGGYLAVGNDRGRALLYRMEHYAPM